MSVLLPLGLIAVIGLPIVIVLHMRHATPPIQPFPTLRFWLAAEPDPIAQTRFRRPPLSLLLLLQLLIVGLLAFALVRPVTSHAWNALGLDLRTEPRHELLLLDGSTSMSAVDTTTGRTRFEEARADAVDRLRQLREGDVATVLVLGTRTTTLSATDGASLDLLRQRLADLPLPGGRTDLNGAITLARDLLLPNLENRVTLLTDGAVAADPGTVATLKAPLALTLFGSSASGAVADNIAVVDIATEPAGSSDLRELYAEIVNFSATPRDAPVVLVGDGIEIGRQTASVPANGGSVQLRWPLPPGMARATVTVESADLLPADNSASLILRQSSDDLALNILLISDAPSDLQRVLLAFEGAQVTAEPSTNLAAATTGDPYDLIVLEQAMTGVGEQDLLANLETPLLFVNPPVDGPFPASGTMLTPTVTDLRTQDPLLQGVDLAGVRFGETPIYTLQPGQTEVVGAAEGPLLFRAEAGSSPAIVIAFNLSTSNLPRRVAFPILIANAINELAPSPLPDAVPLGDSLRYRPRVGAETVRVAPPTGAAIDLGVGVEAATTALSANDPNRVAGEAAPTERLREIVYADTGQAGVYGVTEIDAAGETLGGGQLVVNAGHPRESDLRPTPDLAAILAGTSPAAVTGRPQSSLTDVWPLLAALALGVLAIEWLAALLPWRGSRNRAPTVAPGRAGSGPHAAIQRSGR